MRVMLPRRYHLHRDCKSSAIMLSPNFLRGETGNARNTPIFSSQMRICIIIYNVVEGVHFCCKHMIEPMDVGSVYFGHFKIVFGWPPESDGLRRKD